MCLHTDSFFCSLMSVYFVLLLLNKSNIRANRKRQVAYECYRIKKRMVVLGRQRRPAGVARILTFFVIWFKSLASTPVHREKSPWCSCTVAGTVPLLLPCSACSCTQTPQKVSFGVFQVKTAKSKRAATWQMQCKRTQSFRSLLSFWRLASASSSSSSIRTHLKEVGSSNIYISFWAKMVKKINRYRCITHACSFALVAHKVCSVSFHFPLFLRICIEVGNVLFLCSQLPYIYLLKIFE